MNEASFLKVTAMNFGDFIFRRDRKVISATMKLSSGRYYLAVDSEAMLPRLFDEFGHGGDV